ncbi:MAG: GxxExxY protein [Tangfeifania sp.]
MDIHRLDMTLRHQKLTEDIKNVFYHVYNELGYGFLEKVYQNNDKKKLPIKIP